MGIAEFASVSTSNAKINSKMHFCFSFWIHGLVFDGMEL